MKKVRVLYNVESMEVAGAERVVLAMLGRLDRMRFEPIVCCLTERGALAERVEAMGIPVIALNKDPKWDLPVIPRLMKVMKEQQVDIVHTHSWPANVWGRVAARLAGVPVIVATEHSVHAWKSPAHLRLDRWLANVTDRVICCSNAVETFYREHAKIKPSKLERIYNGIDLEPWTSPLDTDAKRIELGIGAGRRVVTVVARLLPEKGHRFFLDSLARVKREVPSVLGLIVGGGETRDTLGRQAKYLGLDENLLFLGERSDVPDLLKISDLFVLPSLREGLPLAVLEAMACEKPVIVTDVGGNREAVLDGECGFVIPVEDTVTLAQDMLQILSNPKLGAGMGKAGRKRVEAYFSLGGMVRANEQAYENLLARKRRKNDRKTLIHK